MLIGSFGLFMTLFLLFIRFLPIVAMAEVKAVLANQQEREHNESKSPAAEPAAG
jgi:molybdopterin-containing oxidoreductase family membrane subunit